ncbi:MAG: histidine phosphatase family protein [Bacteroidetes bacterium]|nr:histidine phosphatase family protein [Bacteroidota bacterium]
MKRLLIMRHAKSSWDDRDRKDFDRPLNKRGRRDAPAMGKFLKSVDAVPSHLISSPAARAKETVELLANGAGIKEPSITWDEDLYFNGPEAYLEAVRRSPGSQKTVLIAGHNPSVEQFIQYLLGSDENGPRITTANIACFITDVDNWSDIDPKTCEFKWLMRPKKLK